jgi:hypothetical protein
MKRGLFIVNTLIRNTAASQYTYIFQGRTHNVACPFPVERIYSISVKPNFRKLAEQRSR